MLRKSKSHYFDPGMFFKKEPSKDVELLVWHHQKDGTMVCLR